MEEMRVGSNFSKCFLSRLSPRSLYRKRAKQKSRRPTSAAFLAMFFALGGGGICKCESNRLVLPDRPVHTTHGASCNSLPFISQVWRRTSHQMRRGVEILVVSVSAFPSRFWYSSASRLFLGAVAGETTVAPADEASLPTSYFWRIRG